jgi:5'-3' exonuclease
MAKEEILVIVDGTWHIHRAFHIRPSSIQYMVLGWVCQYIVETKATHVLVAFDSGRSFRHDILDTYKGNRPVKQPGEVGPSDYLLPVSRYLESLGFYCEFGECFEADDLLHTGSVQWQHHTRGKSKVILATPDKDNHQGLSKVCHILKPGSKAKGGNVLFTAADLLRTTGFTPQQYLDYQTLIGDGTDNIPKIMTPAVAKGIILRYKTLKAYLEKNRIWANENARELNRNRRLVKLLDNCFELQPNLYSVDRIKKNRQNIKSAYYKQLSIKAPRSLF